MKQLIILLLLFTTSLSAQDVKLRIDKGQLKYSIGGQPFEFVNRPASATQAGVIKLGTNMSLDAEGKLVITSSPGSYSSVTQIPGYQTNRLADQGVIAQKADKTGVYEDIEVADYPALQAWITSNPTAKAIITVLSDINNKDQSGNPSEGVYRFRKGKLGELLLL